MKKNILSLFLSLLLIFIPSNKNVFANLKLNVKAENKFTNEDTQKEKKQLKIDSIKLENHNIDIENNVIEPSMSVEQGINHAAKWMLENVKNPTYKDEWKIFGLVRSECEVDENYYKTYYENLVKEVRERKGELSRSKYTEYSRVVITLTAMGKNPKNVGGYDLVEKLYDFDKVSSQGINGVIFALIALDTDKFDIPVDKNNSREKMIANIVDSQLSDGGFSLYGDIGDVDITAMAIQALSNYTDQDNVRIALDKAINFLSIKQQIDGGYESWGTSNVESVVQTLVALTSIQIDVKDNRFVKNRQWLISNIMSFVAREGGFKHSKEEKTTNAMATEQVLYGLASYKRYINKNDKLYDMTNVSKKTENEIQQNKPENSELDKKQPEKIEPDNSKEEVKKETGTAQAKQDKLNNVEEEKISSLKKQSKDTNKDSNKKSNKPALIKDSKVNSDKEKQEHKVSKDNLKKESVDSGKIKNKKLIIIKILFIVVGIGLLLVALYEIKKIKK
jgi:hypothetical protein